MAEVYDKVLLICERYFSGSGKKFLDRQITSHLNKSPAALATTDMAELAKWCKTSGSLLIGNEKAEKLSKEIISL